MNVPPASRPDTRSGPGQSRGESSTGRVAAIGTSDLQHDRLAGSARCRSRPIYRAVKRCLDVVASGAGLALLSPALLAIGVLVRATSPGPVLFVQERVGLGGRPFRLFKFRSMVVGGSGPQVTSSKDARITRVGRVLRNYKLDELPQLLNVLRGDMSLVGPRPEVQRYVDRFRADYEVILMVRPGITDYAAVEYRGEEALLGSRADPERAYVEEVLPAKIRLYYKYIETMSLRTDLALIARTLLAVIH